MPYIFQSYLLLSFVLLLVVSYSKPLNTSDLKADCKVELLKLVMPSDLSFLHKFNSLKILSNRLKILFVGNRLTFHTVSLHCSWFLTRINELYRKTSSF